MQVVILCDPTHLILQNYNIAVIIWSANDIILP